MNNIDICKELHQNFIDFAVEANTQRAFPDARDGLKPGQRACLWEMFTKGYLSNRPHVKSAKIAGGVIASWHPHGNVAVYETFARMSQPWINNVPEVDWHGANGSIVMGSKPASDRYTEARLAKATEQGMFENIKKNTVPMILNFSEDEEWPEVLPAIFPRLLVNGSQGIGVTIANHWIPMNLDEVASAIIKYIEDGTIDYNSLAPDFPTGGIIINKDELHTIYETGKGKAVVRGRVEIKGNKILITELPYQVYIEEFIDSIKDLIKADDKFGIKEILNKTDKTKVLIEIICDDNPSKILAKLYASTDLQKNFNANQFALVGKTPKLLNIKEYFDIYLEHNLKCIKNETQFDYNKAKDRLEIVEGLAKAVEDIDNIISLIKQSNNSADAQNKLIEKYSFTERQAKAIVDMRLGKLAKLEGIELMEEKDSLDKKIRALWAILNNPSSLKSIIKERLSKFTNNFKTKRKTELTQISLEKKDKEIETVQPEEVVVVVSENNEIKRIPKSSFKQQKRNGTGVKTKQVKTTFSTNTIDNLLVFTSLGKMYRVLVDDIPTGTNATLGKSLENFINLQKNERIVCFTTLQREENSKFILFITQKGLIKKTKLSDLKTTGRRNVGVNATTLNEDDSIVDALFIDDEDIILLTKENMVLRIRGNYIPVYGKSAKGVKGINLNDSDYVVQCLKINSENDYLVVTTEKGYGKKIIVNKITPYNRGAKGNIIFKKSPEIGLFAAGAILEKGKLLINGKSSSIVINLDEVSEQDRNTLGVKLIKGTDITSISVLD